VSITGGEHVKAVVFKGMREVGVDEVRDAAIEDDQFDRRADGIVKAVFRVS
jgi:hypothetical protein